MPNTLILYTREGCHLCHEAFRLATATGAEVRPVDISGDIGLLERYHSSIPVLRHPGSNEEIRWPFGAAEIAGLLARP